MDAGARLIEREAELIDLSRCECRVELRRIANEFDEMLDAIGRNVGGPASMEEISPLSKAAAPGFVHEEAALKNPVLDWWERV